MVGRLGELGGGTLRGKIATPRVRNAMQRNFVPRVRVFGPNNERFCGYHNKKNYKAFR